ncbi:MAG: hypothetical protein IT436_04330 [Phycisphaerales bacterium]|nr:hypothetical protein [Phycisphaerales bacterium]
MTNRMKIVALMTLAGFAAPAFAQDSVSRNSDGGNGLPGDALNTWASGVSQRSSYVVDMTPLYGSWGTRFGIAPVLKTSKSASAFFGSLTSAQAMSPTIAGGRASFSPSYSLWTQRGGGVNPTESNPALVTSVPGPSSGIQFGVGIAEFATDDGGRNTNNILTGIVNVDPANPSRLYVTRIMAAHNQTGSGVGDTSQLGFGSVDSLGNTYFRADNGGGTTTGTPAILNNNIFRVRAASRGTGLNAISDLGGSDAGATDWLIQRSTTQHNPPGNVGADVAGRPVYIGANGATNYVYESAPGVTSTTAAHRPGATDHRGAIGSSSLTLFGGVGTAAVLSQSSGGGGSTDSISVWAVDATGNVVPGKAYTLTKPATTVDSCSPGTITGPFDQYRSQTVFRGGTGQASIGRDSSGRGLVAGVVYDASLAGATDPYNGIVVGRFDPANPAGTVQWNLAAWNTASLTGKDILGDNGNDGAPFTGDPGEFDGVVDENPLSPTYDAPIGRLAALFEWIPTRIGPSMSCPVFDSKGNLYFIAAVGLKKAGGITDFDSALIRGRYDPATFCYKLELMIELGDTFMGQNSGLRYQIQFMEIADGNSIGSGTMFSGNGTQSAFANTDPATLGQYDPAALGGLVIAASYTYDAGGQTGGDTPDASYDDPTGASSFPGSRDEAYNALFYIGNIDPLTVPCPADLNGDGIVDFSDYLEFLNLYDALDPRVDFNMDGIVDFSDYLEFLNFYDAGC